MVAVMKVAVMKKKGLVVEHVFGWMALAAWLYWVY